MIINKFQINKDMYFIAVVDDNDVVITSGVFNSISDAEVASDMLYTIIIRCGLEQMSNNDIPEKLRSNISLNDLLNKLNISYIPNMVAVDN